MIIFDARYQYEYNGGHIKGSVNLDESAEFLESLLTTNNYKVFSSQNAIDYLLFKKRLNFDNLEELVSIANADENLLQEEPSIFFYCEFSSARAPGLFNKWRQIDREVLSLYPNLKFENIYLLNKGYSKFVKQYPELCSNDGGYVTMRDKRFESEMNEGFNLRKSKKAEKVRNRMAF